MKPGLKNIKDLVAQNRELQTLLSRALAALGRRTVEKLELQHRLESCDCHQHQQPRRPRVSTR